MNSGQRIWQLLSRLTKLDSVNEPSLPGSKPPKNWNGKYRRGTVTLSFPFVNIGTNLPVLMTTLSGNLFELGQFSGLKLLDFDIPPQYQAAHPGPQFGIAGTRKLCNVYHRPIIGTIIKPSVGLSPEQTAELVSTLAAAELDFVKDDKLMADAPHSPLEKRARLSMTAIVDYMQQTGKQLMYAYNISGDIDHMRRAHDLIYRLGGTCVMVNMIQVGLPAIMKLREHSELPIHGHRNGWGMFNRHPLLGMEYRAFQKFYRLAGVDHLHVNGIRNKFAESDASVIAAAKSVLEPLWDNAPYRAMPVFSSGQWAGQAPDTYKALGTTDLMYLAGGGIMAHPAGPAAGVRSLKQAWEAAMQNIPLQTYANDHPELRQSLGKYGAR